MPLTSMNVWQRMAVQDTSGGYPAVLSHVCDSYLFGVMREMMPDVRFAAGPGAAYGHV